MTSHLCDVSTQRPTRGLLPSVTEVNVTTVYTPNFRGAVQHNSFISRRGLILDLSTTLESQWDTFAQPCKVPRCETFQNKGDTNIPPPCKDS